MTPSRRTHRMWSFSEWLEFVVAVVWVGGAIWLVWMVLKYILSH